jgi:DNA invertase Pin-like site-specific DNA recombinase
MTRTNVSKHHSPHGIAHDNLLPLTPPTGRAIKRNGKRQPSAANLRRQLQLAEVNSELDRLVAEFHAQLPRSEASQIGGIYARYSTQFQDSIIDQVRALLEFALRNQIFVPREFIFIDLAEKGGKERRPGLTLLRSALAERQFKVLLVFATSRLFRKSYKSVKLVEEEIVERGLRCIFIKSGIDTGDKDRWRLHLQLLASMDEAYSTIYSENIRAALVGLASQKFVHGTLAVGYRGEPVPGQFTKRRRPRCVVAIDEVAARYVRQVFEWFGNDLLPIDEIVRRLNEDPQAPKPAKSEDRRWSHQSVVRLLSNERYIGNWDCGKTESRWISSADYSRQFPRDKPLGTFVYEDLRIVDDQLWHKAQARLATFVKRRGRKPGSGKRKPALRLLNGLFYCPEHDCALRIGGANAGSFYCKRCRETAAKARPLFTLLNQELAERCTVLAIRELLTGDTDLVEMIVSACQRAAEALQQPDPGRLAQLRSRYQQLTRSIEVALRDPGETAEDQAETAQLVRQLRQERAQVGAEIRLMETAQAQTVKVPSRDEAIRELERLDAILMSVSASGDAGQQAEARAIVELVTGGRIDLFQRGERKQHKGWLEGRFECHLIGLMASRLAGQKVESAATARTVVIEYREPSKLDEQARQAREMFDQGLLNVEIARRLKCSKSRVTRLLIHSYEQTGGVKPDGRKRRSQLAIKHSDQPPYQRLSERVMQLYQEDVLLQDIALELELDRNTVTQAIRYWHTSRGLPVPDGRTRRKRLPRKGKENKPPNNDSGKS